MTTENLEMQTIFENPQCQNRVGRELNFPLETPDIDTSSDDYAKRFAGSVGQWFLQVQAKATLSMLAEWPRAMVLDVGGGHGQLVMPLLLSDYQVTVLGSSAQCQHRLQQFSAESKFQFKVGNILCLPFDNRSFDVVIAFRLLPHVNNWVQLIAEMTRVARKAVIVDYPSLKSINYLTPMLFGLKKKYEGNTRHYASFYEKDLVQVFQTHGFIPKARYPEFLLPMVFHRALRFTAFSVLVEDFFRRLGLTAAWGSPVILKMIRENK